MAMTELPDNCLSVDGRRSCPLCTSEAVALPPAHGREFNHCVACDLIFVPKRLHLPPTDEKARYDTHQNTLENAGYLATFRPLIDRLLHLRPPPATILDYGCHVSQVLVELFRREDYDATGYDPYYTESIEAITATRTAFDCVVSTETIEHFAHPALEFDRMIRLIRAGGYFALMTRFHAGTETIQTWWYARDPTHVAFYSHATLDWIAREHGLDIVERNDRDLCIMKKRG